MCDKAGAEIEHDTNVTNQGQRHAHDHRGEDEIEGGDLKHVAVRVWVCVDIFILSGHVQGRGTTILTRSLLEYAKINMTAAATQAVSNNVHVLLSGDDLKQPFLPALRT